MMGLSLAEADTLSLHDYEEILANWNDAHSTDDAHALDPENAMRILDAANADPRLIN